MQQQDDLGRATLERQAERVSLDRTRFVECLDSGRTRGEVAGDTAQARAIGVTVAPTFFVNGRYLKGPQTIETLREAVDAELVRRGIDPQRARVEISPPTSTTVPGPVAEAAPMPLVRPDENSPANPATTISLPADVVGRALRQPRRLERALERPPIDLGPGYEGRRLVRLRKVEPGGLYDAMGLERGDVLAMVDGVLMLDDGKALREALASGRPVTVRILRRGLVRVFEYTIEP